MRQRLFTSILLCVIALGIQAQTETDNSLFEQITNDALILTKSGLLTEKKDIRQFVQEFLANNQYNSYKHEFSVEVNSSLSYEIGQIQSNNGSYAVMFIRGENNSPSQNIEFLVIYQRDSPMDVSSILESRRTKWMELCNSHKATELVKQLYTPEAYYYNRGRVIKGTEAISQEYSYMNASNYSLKLTPKHIAFVSPTIAYEIGRCSGSYPLPYMLLWEKQSDGNWQVKMDSNY
ncbi:hypothetical protein BFP97_04655 [Roseivirga sp. 4D4]|uniref:YybH family protein n=1 Tax=Roseivirga sp. 4D4 TaxID=1889784 RepID=UPI0008537D8D|nr:hypothetical protein [Roseivirga sp. 4D4]OEK00842.1 hypothetical protein BFP97_04655 [Roseivirga sp. 4D4]